MPETGLNRLQDGPLTTLGIYTLQLTFRAANVRERLAQWGFNHLGGWSFCEEKIGLPYIANLDLGRMSEALWFDAFDPELPARVMDWAERLTVPHRERGLRIGYFPDNEVGWWNAALFEFYLSKGWENHTKQLLWHLLHDRYEGNWPELLRDWVPSGKIDGSQVPSSRRRRAQDTPRRGRHKVDQ